MPAIVVLVPRKWTSPVHFRDGSRPHEIIPPRGATSQVELCRMGGSATKPAGPWSCVWRKSALSCGRGRVRWPAPLAATSEASSGRAGRASAEARPARSCCAALISAGTRGALCGPRSMAPRAAAAPRSGGAYSYKNVGQMPQRELFRRIQTKSAKNIPNTKKTSTGRHLMAWRILRQRRPVRAEHLALAVGILALVALAISY